MSYSDEVFYQPGANPDPEAYILAEYDVITNDLIRAYHEIPAESSVGTWTRVSTLTEDILKRLSSFTYDVQELIPGKKAHIKVAYPLELFEPGNLPQLLSLVAGNIYGMKTIDGLRLTNLYFPKEYADSFHGPRFGIQGIYDTLQVKQGPILGSIIKPKLGLPPDQHAAVAYNTWKGGVLWIKDDEPMTNQRFCDFENRISKVLEMADKIKEELGHQVIYAANITGTVKMMEERAQFVKDHGGKCLMIDVVTTGVSAVQHIRELDFGLPIHAHRAMHAAFTRHPDIGMTMKALGKIMRLAGVDAIHTGTIFGKMEGDKHEVLDTNAALRESMGTRIKPVMPIASGGVSPRNIGQIVQTIGRDVIITAGGGIHGHPNGSEAGAKSLVQAVEAALQGVPHDKLETWAHENQKTELIAFLNAIKD